MAQWNNNDAASNSVLWGVTQYNLTPNSVNRDAFYDNVSRGVYKNNNVALNIIAGQFGVDTTEIGMSTGNIVHITATSGGTGYVGSVAATITNVAGGGYVGSQGAAIAYSTAGKITSIIVANTGYGYHVNPTVTLPAPTGATFNSNSAVTGGASTGLITDANSTIAVANTFSAAFSVGDTITYTVANGNTAIGGLTANTTYYVQQANSSGSSGWLALSATNGGDRITLTKGFTETGHTLQGTTATAVAVIGGGKNKGITHAGWNIRTVGTGGRAGRVQYETLVAMGSMTGDGSDDKVLPDA